MNNRRRGVSMRGPVTTDGAEFRQARGSVAVMRRAVRLATAAGGLSRPSIVASALQFSSTNARDWGTRQKTADRLEQRGKGTHGDSSTSVWPVAHPKRRLAPRHLEALVALSLGGG